MNCDEIKENLYGYLTEKLPETIHSEIDSHQKTCPACQRELEELKIDLKLLNLARPPELSVDFKDRVMGRIKQPKIIPFYRKKTYRTILQGTVAAVVVLAVAVAFIIKSTQQPREPVVRGSEKVPTIAEACTKAVELYNKGTMTKDLIAREQLFKDALICKCSDKKIQAKIYNNLADCYEQQGRLDEAIKTFKTAISLDQDLYIAYLGLVDIYKKQNNIQETIRYYKKAILIMDKLAEGAVKQGDIEKIKNELDSIKAK